MKILEFSTANSDKENWMVMYNDFLTFEHTTPQKALWLEQKKIYGAILNAEDFDAALEEFESHGITCAEMAKRKLNDRRNP